MEFYKWLNGKIKVSKSFKIKDVAEVLSKDYDAVRMAIKRQSFSELEKREISIAFGDANTQANMSSVSEPFEHAFLQNTNGNSFELLPNGKYRMTVPLIPAKGYARYISDINDGEPNPDYLPQEFVVDQYAKGNYIAVEVKGDSMDGGGINDTPDKAVTLCRELGRQHWRDGFRDSLYGWMIVTKGNIVFKDILKQDLKAGTIICHSRNPSPEYSDFELSLDEDVLQIFRVIKRTF